MFIKESNDLAFIDFSDKKYSYKEFMTNIKKYSSLYDELNGKNVLILSENRPEWLYSFFSIWNNAGIAVAIDANSNLDEIAYVLNDSAPEIIFCTDGTKERVEKSIGKIGIL